MRVALALALIVAVPGVAASPLLVAVVPDLPGSSQGDEGFAIGCQDLARRGADCDLTGHSVTDGESSWTFAPGTTVPASATLWLVGNLTVWKAHDGPGPAMAAIGLPRLGNDGDELTLAAPGGTVLDTMAFGDGTDLDAPASPGLVLQRRPRPMGAGQAEQPRQGWQDTGTGDDWRTPRLHRIGESALAPAAFEVDRVVLYASPDSSFDVLTGLVANARERLHLHVYELRSAALADALVAAKQAHPSLDLQVLVDGNPVGAGADDRHATADALRRIQAVGGVAVLAGNGRYDDHHLKLLVADDAVAVQSENWVPSGVPEDPSWGNRGWGLVAYDAPLADWSAAWMAEDRSAWDSEPFVLAAYDPLFKAPLRQAPRTGAYGPAVLPLELVGPIRIRPVVAPDHTQDPASDPINTLAAHASRRLDVEQLDLSTSGNNRLGWSSSDPLADAIIGSSQAGARVRVLASSPFSPDDTGNRDALAWLDARGVDGALFDRAGLILHNKGIVADDAVVVGSLNGNLHSRAQNREVAFIVDSAAAADYYDALFDADWDHEGAPRDWSVPGRDIRGLPLAPWPILLAVLGVVATCGRRWS
ncbi:MAG TPA: phospholipase D-like domain-containing protein [Candidatus Thermoplasmatota archaeon]|nr:phospholipase D-like domain-containing protein [Candidatus Thermoplasmatota archaeon]